MNPDFIQLRSLEGDLKMSHKKRDYGLTISTKELVLHKPHVNYYFKLDDIISIIPYEIQSSKAITITSGQSENRESSKFFTGNQLYKLFVKGATVHNRSGIFPMGPTDVIIPIHDLMLKAIAEIGGSSGLSPIPT
jgi:hypothetical protein